MTDDRTESRWEHIQGECIDGVWQGHMLETRQSLRYMTAEHALRTYPHAHIAISRPSLRRKLLHFLFLRHTDTAEGHLPFMFKWSMTAEDTRRNRLEIGLGIWSENGTCSRFYPLSVIREHNNIIIDRMGGENILIYIDPHSGSPEAIYTRARHAKWVQDALILDTGEAYRNGQLYSDIIAISPNRPRQLFTRWYGFSYTFPMCSIYE